MMDPLENQVKKFKIEIFRDIGDIIGEYSIYSASLDWKNSLWVLAVSPEWRKSAAVPTGYQKESLFNYRVLQIATKTVQNIELEHQAFGYYIVQPILGDKLLLCNSRVLKYPDNSRELNAKILDSKGHLVNEFLLGDGIEDIQVTANDIIWTSYFDEGIYGNPIASPGIRSWTSDGQALYFWDARDGNVIEDCFAMNVVSDEEVWFYYYSDFNLVKLVNKQVKIIKTDIKGSDGFVLYDKFILFRGGYNEEDKYCLYELTNTGLKERLQLVLYDETNNMIVAERISCRGSVLVIQIGTKLIKLDLREIITHYDIR